MNVVIKIISKVKSTKVSLFNFFILFALSSFCTDAQESIIVNGRFIGNTKYAKVVMKKFEIGSFPVGGATIKDEKFSISLPHDIPAGVYRFQYAMGEAEKYLDIVINGKEKEITFTLEANNELSLPTFLVSDENKQWYAYIAQNRNQMERFSILTQFIFAYPDINTAVVKAAERELEMERLLYSKNLENFKKQMQGTWAFDMVVNSPYYFTNPKDDLRIQDFEKKEHFWDGFDANDVKLINTPLYTDHILHYLRYWMNPNMNFTSEERTNGFKKAVDIILRKFSGNEQTLTFAYKYLTLGFKEIGEEDVLKYLDENFGDLSSKCFDDFEKSEFENRMLGYSTLKVGNKAPDFHLFVDGDNKRGVKLYSLRSKNTLVVFWSSSCPHCLDEMPKLNDWASKQMAVKVLAVSLDMDSKTFRENVFKFSSMIHTCDFKGWNTEAASKYFIAATPTFILLDKSKKIIGKYSSLNQVLSVIKN